MRTEKNGKASAQVFVVHMLSFGSCLVRLGETSAPEGVDGFGQEGDVRQ